MSFFARTMSCGKTKSYLKNSGIFLTGLITALLAVWFLGSSLVSIEGIVVKAALSPAPIGITELHLPPFGVIEARTHQGPIKLSLTMERIDSGFLKDQLANTSNRKDLLQRLQKGIEDFIFVFALRQFAIALLAAFLVILAVWRTHFKTALLYALLCTALLSLPVIYAVSTYHPYAFNEPKYQGVLSLAPSALEFVSNSLTNLDEVKENTEKIVANFRRLYTNTDSLMVMADAEEQQKIVKALLVSDLHSNPVGVEFIKSTADCFQVDFIINAGDLTDLGSSAEAEAIKELQNIQTPQLFVAGNHDRPEIMSVISKYGNVTVLDGQLVTISGIKVTGYADPLANADAVQYENMAEGQQIMADEAVRIRAELNENRPDILVVHNNRLGLKLMSLANVTVSGHDHQLQMKQQHRSVFINPGTTGAAGLRGLYSEEGQAYSAVIAYLLPGSGLIAMDLIDYKPASNQYSLHRKVVQPVPDNGSATL